MVCLILPHHCNTAATVDWSKSSPSHDCTVARLSLCSGCLTLSSVRDARGHVPACACMFVISDLSDLCWWFDKLISDESCFQAVANMQLCQASASDFVVGAQATTRRRRRRRFATEAEAL